MALNAYLVSFCFPMPDINLENSTALLTSVVVCLYIIRGLCIYVFI